MKKLFAIVMVVVILFNSGGYDFLFQYLIYRSDSKTFDRINHSRYRASDLVEVKVPVDFPAQTLQEYSGEYEPVSGQIQIKNNKYDYAEIKITHDTLYLRVIPNPDLNKLVNASVQYGKLVNDLPASNSKHPTNSLTKKSLGESELLTYIFIGSPQIEIKTNHQRFINPSILKPALEVGGQPPEV